MHKILLPISLLVIFLACNNPANVKQPLVSSIDTTVTAANAYNNFFTDSTALEIFIQKNAIEPNVAAKMRLFYYGRNFEYAWLAADGLTEQAQGFWNLHNYYTVYNTHDSLLNSKKLAKQMKLLNETDSVALNAHDTSTLHTELMLTEHFILYLEEKYDAAVLNNKGLENFVPIKKTPALLIAKNILATKEDAYEKANEPYQLLKKQLQKYYNITTKGGWPAIAYTARKWKKGDSHPVIAAVKKRLQLTGELTGLDTTIIFDDTLETAVKTFQINNGYSATAIITDSLLKDMNVPAEKRLQQLLININRMRWLPGETEERLIVTNLPEFILHVYENNKETFNMGVVVGKEGHSTLLFTSKLTQLVFSPYWNVPPSIVKNEILPAIRSNPNYLAQKNMEQTGESEGLPIIRQKPGGNNALGKVKFLFPNALNIYFHDTPEKSLFTKDSRAYSHGCIRLSDPHKLAVYLLQDNPQWSEQKINEVMNSGKEKFVDIKKPVPVIITYYTAWVAPNGQLNFRKDIYDHDAEVAARLFTDPL